MMAYPAFLYIVLSLFTQREKEGAAKVMFERVTKITLPPYPQGYDSVLEYENMCGWVLRSSFCLIVVNFAP